MGKLNKSAQVHTPGVMPWHYLRPWKACDKCKGREVYWIGTRIYDCDACATGYLPDRQPGDFFHWLGLCILRIFCGALTLAIPTFGLYLIGINS